MSAAGSVRDIDRDALKRAAAEAAVELVSQDMIVGLGSGSTATFAIEALARRHRKGLRFVGIPTSDRTAAQATAAGIPLTSFAKHRQIDLTIDGADEVERGTLNLIKGLGGALLREKIVAAASHRLAIVVDGTKLVDQLGTRASVPVEVAAFGLEVTQEFLKCSVPVFARACRRKAGPSSPTAATGFSIATSIPSAIRLDWRSELGTSLGSSKAACSLAALIRSLLPAQPVSTATTALARTGAVHQFWLSWGFRDRANRRSPKCWPHASAGPSRRAIRFIPKSTS